LKKIIILNCNFGNIDSVFNAIDYLGYKPIIVSNFKKKLEGSHLILPGVGNFFYASKKVIEFELKAKIDTFLKNGGFILGICLGMQLLFSKSEESGEATGLNYFNGKCEIFKKDSSNKLPLPHIGFSKVYHPDTSLWNGIKNPSDFYFVHNFRIKKIKKNSDDLKVGYSLYGDKFISYIEKKNIFGVQFHPEKSHNNGLKLLKNFLELNAL